MKRGSSNQEREQYLNENASLGSKVQRSRVGGNKGPPGNKSFGTKVLKISNVREQKPRDQKSGERKSFTWPLLPVFSPWVS